MVLTLPLRDGLHRDQVHRHSQHPPPNLEKKTEPPPPELMATFKYGLLAGDVSIYRELIYSRGGDHAAKTTSAYLDLIEQDQIKPKVTQPNSKFADGLFNIYS